MFYIIGTKEKIQNKDIEKYLKKHLVVFGLTYADEKMKYLEAALEMYSDHHGEAEALQVTHKELISYVGYRDICKLELRGKHMYMFMFEFLSELLGDYYGIAKRLEGKAVERHYGACQCAICLGKE